MIDKRIGEPGLSSKKQTGVSPQAEEAKEGLQENFAVWMVLQNFPVPAAFSHDQILPWTGIGRVIAFQSYSSRILPHA